MGYVWYHCQLLYVPSGGVCWLYMMLEVLLSLYLRGNKFAPVLSLCGGKVGGGAVTLVVC